MPPKKRPRPKSDTTPVTFRLSPGDLARLDRIAEHHGYKVDHGANVGGPNRTEALRKAVREMDRRIAEEKNEKSEKKDD